MDTQFDDSLQQEIEDIVEQYSQLPDDRKLVYEATFDNNFTNWKLKLEAVKNAEQHEIDYIAKRYQEVRVFV